MKRYDTDHKGRPQVTRSGPFVKYEEAKEIIGELKFIINTNKQYQEALIKSIEDDEKVHLEDMKQIKFLSEMLKDMRIELEGKQAQIDMLMTEHCPDEMTAEQVDEWAKRQVKVDDPDLELAIKRLADGHESIKVHLDEL